MNNKIKNVPMISVIMGIYNCEKTVEAAIMSIINQTYQDFELILCDDGSIDGTYDIAKKYQDKYPEKIILIRNDKNRGLNYTLNHCLKYAKGKYIARMDADDESLPNRFEVEVNYLESHPEIAIISASLRLFDNDGVWGEKHFKQYPEPIDLVKSSPFSHSVCMVRSEAYKAVNGYSEGKKLMRVEDLHLWIKMYSKGYRGANLSEYLYMYRDDRDGYTKRKFKYRLNSAYVRRQAVKMFHLPKYNYIYTFTPIIIGLIPFGLYVKLHKRKLNKGEKK